MNENLNLVEILKDAPKGTKFWSPICGECELYMLDIPSQYPIKVIDKANNCICLLSDGRYSNYPNGECVLFPSKENRDWSTFKVPNQHKHFEPFQKVLHAIVNEVGYEEWFADIYSHYNDLTREHYLVSGYVVDDDEIILYEGNEDKLGKPVK